MFYFNVPLPNLRIEKVLLYDNNNAYTQLYIYIFIYGTGIVVFSTNMRVIIL